jgi:putative ABC transport system substrate-binding protein
LRDLGYVEGKNIVIELRSAEGNASRLPELANGLVRSVDVIVVAGTPATRAAKQATDRVPIVIAAIGDALAGGFVAELSRPAGNITGSTYFAPELATKQLEVLKEAFPQLTRLALVFNPDNSAVTRTLHTVQSSARMLRVEVEQFAARDPAEFNDAFAAIARNRYSTALIIDDPMTISNAGALARLAMKHRLATGANFTEYAEAGGLMSYGADLIALWRRAASFVDKILKGSAPGEIPVERATRFDLIINLQTARAIAADIPSSILLRAARVIG